MSGRCGASLYDAYEHYSGALKGGRLGVSKRYYEKVAIESLGAAVTGIHPMEWWL